MARTRSLPKYAIFYRRAWRQSRLNIDVQAYKTYVLYINGEYWGIYHLQEKLNKYYAAQHAGNGDPEAIDLLRFDGVISRAITAIIWR